MADPATATAPAEKYNPIAMVHAALVKADRPMTADQLHKMLPAMPTGTVSGSLYKLCMAKAADRSRTRPAQYRALKADLPKEFREARLSHPVAPGRHRAAHTRGGGARKGGKDLMVVVPVGKRESMTLIEAEARELLGSLARMFGYRLTRGGE